MVFTSSANLFGGNRQVSGAAHREYQRWTHQHGSVLAAMSQSKPNTTAPGDCPATTLALRFPFRAVLVASVQV